MSASAPAVASVGDLFETHLTVQDLARSTAFYRDVVGLSPGYELPDGGGAFFWTGAAGRAMLGLWPAGPAPFSLALHVAFAVSLDDVLRAPDRLRGAGLTPLSFFGSETDEASVIGWMPAAAIYFRDPDGHLLELISMLDEEPDEAAGVVSWAEWRSRRHGLASARNRRPMT